MANESVPFSRQVGPNPCRDLGGIPRPKKDKHRIDFDNKVLTSETRRRYGKSHSYKQLIIKKIKDDCKNPKPDWIEFFEIDGKHYVRFNTVDGGS